ncbi:hypothetical protein [Vibrio cincinnatiensis]|jgi:hypothetical protein|nr:hypothetical protein [Vibrio cincinnatiensis]
MEIQRDIIDGGGERLAKVPSLIKAVAPFLLIIFQDSKGVLRCNL